MLPTKISPLSGRTLSQQVVLNGGVIQSFTQANIDTTSGAVAVSAPAALYPTPELACFMVYDAGGVAAGSPITINGNGRLIDGQSSAIFAVSGGTALFLYDQATNQWRSALLPSNDPNAASPFFLKRDLEALIARPAARLIDYARIGAGAAGNWAVGSFSSGPAFIVQRDLTLVGVNVYLKTSAGNARNLKVTAWRSQATGASAVSLGTETFNALVDATLHRLRFATPIALTCAQNLNDAFDYRIGVWDTAGAFNPYTQILNNGMNWLNNRLPSAFMMRPDVFFRSMTFGGGDARPATFTTTEFCPVTPVFADDADA
jgi:hypothetical protein